MTMGRAQAISDVLLIEIHNPPIKAEALGVGPGPWLGAA
jgi:hypothetical protein